MIQRKKVNEISLEYNKRLKNIYSGMKQRCCNPKHTAARWYHDRGITVCDEWLRNYEAFEKWALSHGYSDEMTIDRIDPDGNYCPGNCQWITKRENLQKARKPGEVTQFRARKPNAEKKTDYVFTSLTEEEKVKIKSIIEQFRKIPPECENYIRGYMHGILDGLKIHGR